MGQRLRFMGVSFGRPDLIEKDHACQPTDYDIVCTHSANATDYQQDPLFIAVFLLGFDVSSSYLVPE